MGQNSSADWVTFITHCRAQIILSRLIAENVRSACADDIGNVITKFTKSSRCGSLLGFGGTQLFISFSPASFSTSIAHLLSVVNQISQWMSSNLLCLNPSKTEFIIIGLPPQIKK